MRIAALTFALTCLISFSARADDLEQPKFSDGDAWIYDVVRKRDGEVKESQVELSIVRTQGDRILVAFKEPGSVKAPVERLVALDWSNARSVNGVETLINRPLSFPLAPGKSWRLDFTEANPTPQLSSQRDEVNYKAVGWETVKTGAGEYKALKIEGVGAWTGAIPARTFNNSAIAKTAPNVAVTSTAQNVVAAKQLTGRIYRLYYYAPAVKRWVKLIEETYNPAGEVMFSQTEILKDFHPG